MNKQEAKVVSYMNCVKFLADLYDYKFKYILLLYVGSGKSAYIGKDNEDICLYFGNETEKCRFPVAMLVDRCSIEYIQEGFKEVIFNIVKYNFESIK